MLAKNNKNVKSHTIKSLLKWAFLGLKDISTSPYLDAEIILSYVIHKSREYLYAHPEKRISKKENDKFKKLINRRKKYEPIAYIIGRKEFYGLSFKVNKNVLIPRPETELMVDEALGIARSSDTLTLIDIGTGSGCIPIVITKNFIHKYRHKYVNQIFGIDISQEALKVAKKNARMNGVDKYIKFLQGDLMEKYSMRKYYNFPLTSNFSKGNTIIITANLPYLPRSVYEHSPEDVKKYEPKEALIGGCDGLKYYKKLFKEIAKLNLSEQPNLKAVIICEIDPSQAKAIKNLIAKYFPKANLRIEKDLAGFKRLVIIKISHF